MSDPSVSRGVDDDACTFLKTTSIFNTTLKTFLSSIDFEREEIELELKDYYGKATT